MKVSERECFRTERPPNRPAAPEPQANGTHALGVNAREARAGPGLGPCPDVDVAYEHVVWVMQQALDDLAAERRLPIVG